MRNLILHIHDGSEMESVTCGNVRRDFSPFGCDVEHVSVQDPQAEDIIRSIIRERGHELRFFYSSNFWALNVRSGNSLLHTLTGIPLVILMQDHPVYFLHQISDALKGVVIFAPGADLIDFIAKHYGIALEAASNPGHLPSGGDPNAAPDLEQFLQRKNKILCPLNLAVWGRNIGDAWNVLKALPSRRSKRALRLLDETLTDCMTPPHVISERLRAAEDEEISIQDLRYVLDFVKLWRRTRLIEMVIDLPILVSTSYIPPALERRHPGKFTLLSRPQTMPLYQEYRFVLNSNSFLMNCFHDRVTEAILNNAVCVTDPNPILARFFEDERDMIFVDYKKTDFASRLQRFLDDPQRAFELTCRTYEIRTRQNISQEAFGELLAVVDRARLKQTQRIG